MKLYSVDFNLKVQQSLELYIQEYLTRFEPFTEKDVQDKQHKTKTASE